jgi:isopentenyl diphosphate isomerase/L-lactate dehydrogenase-like FMN-dependent dehydrogenase
MKKDHYILPKLSQIPADVIAICDYERLAKEYMPHGIYEYIAGGAGDDITLNRNRTAFDAIGMNKRVLRKFLKGTTKVTLGNDQFNWPMLIAPLAYQSLLHPEGELATVEAANAVNMGMLTSTLSTVCLEEIGQRQQTPKWFQLYMQPDPKHTLDLVKRAKNAGYTAIVVTVDAPVSGLRNRQQRAGFSLPPSVIAANLIDYPTSKTQSLSPGQSILLNGLMADAPDWDDIAWLQKNVDLPVWIKGISHPQDGLLAVQSGCAGIVVSNHGGRTLDGLAPSIDLLPPIRNAVSDVFPILLDSGIRRGTDIFKAIALGANGVLIGRPVLNGLAVAGALGVAHSLTLLQQELELAMALTGCETIEDITLDCIY